MTTITQGVERKMPYKLWMYNNTIIDILLFYIALAI